MDQFDELFLQFGEIKNEANEAAKIYMARMLEMNEARDAKLDQNKDIMKGVESQIMHSIKAGRGRLTGVNPFKEAKA